MTKLGPPPRVRIEEVVADRSAVERPFLRLRHAVLRNHYADGTRSQDYHYDLVERAAIDAVGIVLWADTPEGPTICLRAGLRPPLAFRSRYALPIAEPDPAAMIWEIPAGLVEPDEHGAEGLRACAARETMEETGIHVDPEAFGALGPAVALSPGVIGEKLHFLEARVGADAHGTPTMDGSAVEERGEVRFVLLSEALAAVGDGRIADAKTEIALRRLAARRGVD